jgi:hypothetical protein
MTGCDGHLTPYSITDVTRRCDVDQAPRGPLARRTHLTDPRIRSARSEHTAADLPLWSPASGDVPDAEATTALETLEHRPARAFGPTAAMAVIATRGSEGQGDQPIRPAAAAKDQRCGIFPWARSAVCSQANRRWDRTAPLRRSRHLRHTKRDPDRTSVPRTAEHWSMMFIGTTPIADRLLTRSSPARR